MALHEFPSPGELWSHYRAWKGLSDDTEKLACFPYHDDGSGKEPRYYQRIAVQRTIEAIARGERRVLLVMATGTGKTYTAFQIIWRLWKAGTVKRVLFLADRNILVDQTLTNDFKPFGAVMTKVRNRTVDKSYEVYLALYQAVSGTEDEKNVYRQFSPDFFDLVVIDECHRGSAREDSAWREILDYFEPAIQLGLTATPKETRDVSTLTYFGEPVYTYSLKQGIDDGFLAPYKVIRIDLDKDLQGWRPPAGMQDDLGQEIEGGTGGFLACAIEHVRRHEVQTPEQELLLQSCIHGVEKKPLPHRLCTTNMIVHGIDVPTGIRPITPWLAPCVTLACVTG